MNRVKCASVLPVLLSLALLGACRDSSNSNVDGGNNNADAAGGEHTIFDVQNDSMPIGTTVNLRGVVVVAIDTYGGRTGGVYVQEPEGGAFSGVFVFLNDTSAASLTVGDLVDVIGGVKDEFALSDDTTGRTLTEISPPDGGSISITKTGDGTVPTPPVLNPWDLAADDAEAEKWEGVLITFENVRVNSAPRNVSMSDPTLKEMNVTGPFAVSSGLTELADTITREDCYASITGIGDYFFSYKVLPRNGADLVGGGTNCLAPEEGATACGDKTDNDYDGFTDCADFSCVDVAQNVCVTTSTVVQVQDGTNGTTGTTVSLTDVVVTGVTFNRKHLWVQDQGGVGPYNGIYVYRGSSAAELPAEIVAGRVVDVTGKVDEFSFEQGSGVETLTELEDSIVTDKSSNVTPTIVTGQGLTALKDEQYEGVLVTLAAVPVLTLPTGGAGPYEWSVGVAGTDLVIDDDIYRHTPTVSTCVTITGLMSYNGFDTGLASYKRVLIPLGASDVTIVTCP